MLKQMRKQRLVLAKLRCFRMVMLLSQRSRFAARIAHHPSVAPLTASVVVAWSPTPTRSILTESKHRSCQFVFVKSSN